MGAFTSLAQQIDCSARDYFSTVTQEGLNQLLKIENLWLAIDQCHNVDTEHTLQLSLCEKVIENHFANIGTLNFNNDAHSVFIRLITQLGDTFELFLFNQFSNTLDQTRLV